MDTVNNNEQYNILNEIGKENEVQLLIEYAKSWNNLDVSYVKNILSDDFQYTSQWVFETMHGKDKYINYLERKFEVIKRTASLVQAQIGYYEHYPLVGNKPCIVIEQKNNGKTAILIEVNNGKIIKSSIVDIPNPEGAITLNYFPK